jgi:TM2 domain-containing membrane protein YozV
MANSSRASGSEPGKAAVFSFLIPGLGQFYNGAFLRGIFWLVVTPGLWVGTGGTLGWLCHIAAAYTAYTYAERKRLLGP